MHGLQQLHNLNEEAVRNEFNRKCQNIISQGGSYLVKKDSVTGLADHTAPVVSFETIDQLTKYALAKIPSYALADYQLTYGRN